MRLFLQLKRSRVNRRYEKYRTHHQSRRLAGHDYAASGWYFVTICTDGRACFFGAVRGGVMGLSAVGCAAHRCWVAIPDHFDWARLGAFVVMPNHVHGIVGLMPHNNDGIVAPRQKLSCASPIAIVTPCHDTGELHS